MNSRILFVSGHCDDAWKVTQMLHHLPLVLDHAATIHEARAQLQRERYDLILTEANLLDGSWLSVLEMARREPAEPEVIVTDQQADARFWAEALNLGAYDVLARPFYAPEVRRILFNACSHHEYEQYPMAAV